MPLPEKGIIIERKLADKLEVKTGNTVTVETLLGYGPMHQADIKIVGINQQFIDSKCHTSLKALNRLLQEQHYTHHQ